MIAQFAEGVRRRLLNRGRSLPEGLQNQIDGPWIADLSHYPEGVRGHMIPAIRAPLNGRQDTRAELYQGQ